MTGRYKTSSPVTPGGKVGERNPKRRKVGSGLADVDSSSAVESPLPATLNATYSFKDSKFVQANIEGNKKRAWKNLKQILATERSLPWDESSVTYANLDAPPSFKPAKHYADLSGLPTTYKDPQTGLYYATAAEFTKIRQLPYEIVQGYLGMRNALPQT